MVRRIYNVWSAYCVHTTPQRRIKLNAYITSVVKGAPYSNFNGDWWQNLASLRMRE